MAAADGAEVLTLHPKAPNRYSAKVADIHAALAKGDAASREAVALVRELIDHIVVTPGEDGGPMRLKLMGTWPH